MKPWTRIIQACKVEAVEALGICWAVNLAKREGIQVVVIEGDAKVCMDPLIKHMQCPCFQ
jgi:adenine/guanine phosphoribosyltransferase-like PRPP-binding protein